MSSDSKPGHVFSCKRLHKAQKHEPCIWAFNVAYTPERGPLLCSKLLLELIIMAEGLPRGTPVCPAHNITVWLCWCVLQRSLTEQTIWKGLASMSNVTP